MGIKKLALATVVAGGIVVAGTASTTAFDPRFLDCFWLMIVDPAAHSASCIGGVGPAGPFSTLHPLVGGPEIIVVPTVTMSYTSTYPDS